MSSFFVVVVVFLYNDTNLQDRDIIKIKGLKNVQDNFMSGFGQTQLPYTTNK